MTKTGWIVAGVVLLAILGIGFAAFIGMSKAPTPEVAEVAPTPTQEAGTTTPSDTSVVVDVGIEAPSAVIVTYTDAGFAPKQVSIAVGQTVRFVNNSTHTMWVGSNDHPSHTNYDGTSTKDHCAAGKTTNGTFDECVAVTPGVVYNFTFTKAGTFRYHNHMKSSDMGSVLVK